MEKGFKVGKFALRDFNASARQRIYTEEQYGLFSAFIFTQVSSTEILCFFPKNVPRLRKTLVICNEDVKEVLRMIKLKWEDIFRTKGNARAGKPPQSSWATICSPLLQIPNGQNYVRRNLLQQAGDNDVTATLNGNLLARIAPSLLVAIAIMDGAQIFLSHTHQKDIIIRMIGVRLHIIITQSNCLSFCSIDASNRVDLKGTYPLYDLAAAFLETGQSWISEDGIQSTSDLYMILQHGGFCSADREFLSLGFLHQQYITYDVAIAYLNLATQAYEVFCSSYKNLNSAKEHKLGINTIDVNDCKEQIQMHCNTKEYCEDALESLTNLICSEFYEKIGRPNSGRLRAQIMAIRSNEWVPRFLEKYEGKQCTQMAKSATSPPPFDTTTPATPNFIPNIDNGEAGKAPQFLTDITKTADTHTSLGTLPHEKVNIHSIEPQGAAAWLACWSICRMLAHVQIVPAFLGTHRSDAICWVR